jgi:hypothetical protein
MDEIIEANNEEVHIVRSTNIRLLEDAILKKIDHERGAIDEYYTCIHCLIEKPRSSFWTHPDSGKLFKSCILCREPRYKKMGWEIPPITIIRRKNG